MNYNSSPSELKITDLKVAEISGAPMDCLIIRLETNQGIVGYGEVRDFGSRNYAMQLKRHIINENPCNVNKLFDRIKQFGGHARQAGGVSGIEVALMDLAGKAYGIPVYQMLGGKYRDKVRVYCDTDVEGKHSGIDMGNALKKRIEKGYTMVKMDLGIDLLIDIPGAISAPLGYVEKLQKFSQLELSFGITNPEFAQFMNIPHPYTFMQITEIGLDFLEHYVEEVRKIIGFTIPLAIDHMGHINIESCIKLAKRLERFNLAWMEDCIPWFYLDQWKRLKSSCSIPLCTGEDIYLEKNFRPLLEQNVVSVIHPDVFTAGGIMETKKIINVAEEYGISAVIHMAETPVGCMAAASVAAAVGDNFVAMEFHSSEVTWWDRMIKNNDSSLIKNGWLEVSNKPGLGIEELDDEVLRKHSKNPKKELWQNSNYWDDDWSHDRIWS